MPSGNQVTLLGFNDIVFTLTRRTTNPAERVKAVDRLAPWGATALYDAILRSVGMLGRQTGRKVLVVFSDGEDQGSHATIADVERGLQASDVTLYMIGQGRGVTRRSTQGGDGTAVAADRRPRAVHREHRRLRVAFTELLDELSNQYLLGYAPAAARRDETWRSIKVEVDGLFGNPGPAGLQTAVTRSSELSPCASAAAVVLSPLSCWRLPAAAQQPPRFQTSVDVTSVVDVAVVDSPAGQSPVLASATSTSGSTAKRAAS